MPLDEIISRPITGIRPFNELPIDAEIWREAHDQHHLHRRLHAMAAHRPGIVTGLEVVVSGTRERTVVVAPGVGVDADGQTAVLSEPAVFTLEERGQIHIILSFLRATDRNSGITVGSGQQFYRIVEGREVTATRELPTTPFLELARIYRSGVDKPVREAANPFDPSSDEVNLLNRRVAFPHCYASCGVGEMSYVPKKNPAAWKPNRAGLWNLLREGNGRGFHLDFTGPFNLRAQPSSLDPVMLYVAGSEGFQPLADPEVDGLRAFLAGGGLLVAEASGGSAEFTKGMQELATKVGANLVQVTKGHPLLSAQHMFSAPPPGGQDSGWLAADTDAGMVLSTYDYGAGWQGDLAKPDAPDARDRIRMAQEFGLNLVAFASTRKRTRELSRIG